MKRRISNTELYRNYGMDAMSALIEELEKQVQEDLIPTLSPQDFGINHVHYVNLRNPETNGPVFMAVHAYYIVMDTVRKGSPTMNRKILFVDIFESQPIMWLHQVVMEYSNKFTENQFIFN